MNSLPMHGVSAIGRKLPGLVASSAAEVLGMSVMAAHFHSSGMIDCVVSRHQSCV